MLHEAKGDHLDVIGFHDPQPPHTDWLDTGSKFDRAQFEQARFVTTGAGPW